MENGRLSREYAELLINRFLIRYRETAKIYVGCNELECPNRFAIDAKHYGKYAYFGCVECLDRREKKGATYKARSRK